MWHWFLFRIKCRVDRWLYGGVILPPRACPACGYVVRVGERCSPPYHAVCAQEG
jgi:hypothetical protein